MLPQINGSDWMQKLQNNLDLIIQDFGSLSDNLTSNITDDLLGKFIPQNPQVIEANSANGQTFSLTPEENLYNNCIFIESSATIATTTFALGDGTHEGQVLTIRNIGGYAFTAVTMTATTAINNPITALPIGGGASFIWMLFNGVSSWYRWS